MTAESKIKLEYLNEESSDNPELRNLVEPSNDLKNMLVEYVGEAFNPENNEVTLEMVVETMAAEFPEFVLALAEENWVRGYQQALDDVELGGSIAEDDKQE